MDLHVCIKIDDDAVDKIARVVTEAVKRVTEIQQAGASQQPGTSQSQPDGGVPDARQTTACSAQIAQATQLPVQVMTGQPGSAQPQPVPVQQVSMQPAPVQQTAQAQAVQPVPVVQAAAQPSVPTQPTAVPTLAKSYTLDELASAAMLLMDRGMQTQLQDLLAGFGVESLPMLPPEQYGNFATALRGMGAQI